MSMADFTSKQATVVNEMTALEINIQAFHNNLALFGESFAGRPSATWR